MNAGDRFAFPLTYQTTNICIYEKGNTSYVLNSIYIDKYRSQLTYACNIPPFATA